MCAAIMVVIGSRAIIEETNWFSASIILVDKLQLYSSHLVI